MSEALSHIICKNNEVASLSVDLYGGGITDFHLRYDGVNPFTFKLAHGDMPENNRSGASYRGHFICLGRWGPPTPGEKSAGVPDHGQAANIVWTETSSSKGYIRMQALAMLEGLKIERSIRLDDAAAVFKIEESITNINPLSRLYNVVQHPTLAGPFLTKNTVVNCNADLGFNYLLSTKPAEYAAKWPYGIVESGDKINVSKPDKAYSSVFSYTIKKGAEFGWITAYTPELNLLIGYLWRRETYPWINLWQDFDGENIRYRGLEFGTTGMHKPYKQIIEEGNHEVFGECSYLMIDAGETQRKSYMGFMHKTPKGLDEVAGIDLADDQLTIEDINGRKHVIYTTLSI